MQSLMGGFRLAVGRVSLVHTLCYCQHRAPGRRARLDAGGQRMPCKFSSPSHPVLLSAQGPGGAEHVEVQEAGGCLYLPDRLELVLNCTAVSAKTSSAPWHNRSVSQDCRKRTVCRLNLQHIWKFTLDPAAITAKICITVCNNTPVWQDRCESTACSLKMLHTPQIFSDIADVSTFLVTPAYKAPATVKESECPTCWGHLCWLNYRIHVVTILYAYWLKRQHGVQRPARCRAQSYETACQGILGSKSKITDCPSRWGEDRCAAATGQKHVHRQSSSSHSHCFTIIQGLWVHFVLCIDHWSAC